MVFYYFTILKYCINITKEIAADKALKNSIMSKYNEQITIPVFEERLY